LLFALTPGIPAKRYTTDHEVIKFDDEHGIGTVSITDYAQKSLGDVVFVELPEKGKAIQQGGESSFGPNKKNSLSSLFFFFGSVLRNLSRCLLPSRRLYWRRGERQGGLGHRSYLLYSSRCLESLTDAVLVCSRFWGGCRHQRGVGKSTLSLEQISRR
jgi:Glycine cleavage H-protein